MNVRLAKAEDAEAIRQIYNLAVTTSVVTFDLVPRSAEEQRRWLEARSGAHAVVVAEDGKDLVGFASLSPYRNKPAYSTSVEDSIYIHEDHQRQGVGKLLLQELIQVATAHGFHAMFARIVDGAVPSIRLHQSLGFETVGTEREVGRKFGRWLDVLVMEKLL